MHEDVAKGFPLVRDEIVAALGARRHRAVLARTASRSTRTSTRRWRAQPSEDVEPGTVIEVYQQGYRLNGAVLRPARVVVAE